MIEATYNDLKKKKPETIIKVFLVSLDVIMCFHEKNWVECSQKVRGDWGLIPVRVIPKIQKNRAWFRLGKHSAL